MTTKVEYKIRETTRFFVTRYEEGDNTAGSSTFGEYDNADTAYAVGYALCRAEHQRLGWPIADDRIQYPRHPTDATTVCDPDGGLRRPENEGSPGLI